MSKKRLGSIFIIFLVASGLNAKVLTFKQRGVTVMEFSLEELLQKVPAQDIDIFEQHMDLRRVYRGFNFQKLLTLVFSDVWQQSEEILFTCVDGYQPSIPVAKFKTNLAYLVFENKAGTFTLDNNLQHKTNVSLRPFYLVWENVKNRAIRAEGVGDWPYQIVSVDLIRFIDKFPDIAPPLSSSLKAREGFSAFRKECIKCHTINGQGGAMGGELNYPVNVTEYWKENFLIKWIRDPKSIRYHASMPGLDAVDDNAADTAQNVVVYLKAMVRYKRLPSSTVGVPRGAPNKISPFSKLDLFELKRGRCTS